MRVSQVVKAVLGTSPPPRQTPGKRTQRYFATPVITCWHSCPAPYARDGTLRHFLAAISRIGDAFARRRSGVRLPCGPPPRLRSGTHWGAERLQDEVGAEGLAGEIPANEW